MTDINAKNKYIRAAAVTAIAGNALLAAVKITAGVFSNSGALLGDGVDSAADVLISVVTLFAAGIAAKPADTGHPWGHGRAETVACVFLSFVVFFAGAQLIVGAVSDIAAGGRGVVSPEAAAAAAIVSIGGKALLAWSQYSFGRRAGSSMLIANAKNMASDALISVGVLIGLVISAFTRTGYADAIIAALIGLWIIRTAVGIFLEANLELMDGSNDMEPYRVIAEAVSEVEGASNPHRARIRRIAGLWDIDFDIDVDPDLTVACAHELALRVERKIKLRLDNVYDIMIHIEPCGDENEEGYGLSEELWK